MPQPPQFALSVAGSTHPSPHKTRPCGQTQTPLEQILFAGHTLPHMLQLFLSVKRSVHAEPQYVCPVGHTHWPPWQLEPPMHELAQPPQFALSVCVLTHTPLQNTSPAVAHVQVAFWQVAPPGPLHVVPHMPQFTLSEFKSTHPPLQSVSTGPESVWQLAAHTPLLQTPCPLVGPVHLLPHDPQLARSALTSTHCPAHTVGFEPFVHVQAPAMHCWSPEHAVPQAPQ